MNIVETTTPDEVRRRIEARFRNELSVASPYLTIDRSTLTPTLVQPAGISQLKYIQSLPVNQAIHPDYVDIVQGGMSETISLLGRLDGVSSTIIHIKNAPLNGPFGKGNDSQYQNQFPPNHPLINDRLPIAEIVLMSLTQSANLTIDSFPNDNHGQIWSYPTPLAHGKGQNNEEHGARTIFPLHTDGSMNKRPSEFIMLTAGIGTNDAETIIVDTEKLLEELQRYDTRYLTQVVEILKKPIFKHIPGTSSVDTDDILVAPILNISPSGKIFFRGNLAKNNTGERIGLVDGLSETEIQEAKHAISVYDALAMTPENHTSIVIDTNAAIFFSNGPHARSSFKIPEDPAKQRYLARFGGKTASYEERFKNIALAEAVHGR